MSSAVRSQNLFELLGEDDSGNGAIPTPKAAPKAAAPAPKVAAPAAAAPAKKEAARPAKSQQQRGERAPRAPRGEEPGASVGEVFDKRRSQPSGARGGRGGAARRVPAGAASHGGFDRKSGGHVDSQKKIENGSGHVTGDAELADEVAGAADAEADAKAAAASGVATPAEGEAKEKKEETARPKRTEEEEEEDNTQSYAEYLAAKASAAIEGVASLTKRVVEEWTGEGAVVKKEGEDAFFAAKEKKERALKARKEKNTIEIDGKFASEDKPARAPAARGGRGGAEGGRGGRGGARGARGGAFRGGAPRAAPVARKEKAAAVNLADESAFPSLA